MALLSAGPEAERSPQAAAPDSWQIVPGGGIAHGSLPAIALSDRDEAPAADMPLMMPAIVETEIPPDEFEIRSADQATSSAMRRGGRHTIRSGGHGDAAAMLAVRSTDRARLCRRLL